MNGYNPSEDIAEFIQDFNLMPYEPSNPVIERLAMMIDKRLQVLEAIVSSTGHRTGDEE